MRGSAFRGVPIAAVILIVAGTVLLLQNFDVLPWFLWLHVWQF